MEKADIIEIMIQVEINIIEMTHTKNRKNNLTNIITKVIQENMVVDLGQEEGVWMMTTITLRRMVGVVIPEAIIINLDISIKDEDFHNDNDDILMMINNMKLDFYVNYFKTFNFDYFNFMEYIFNNFNQTS